MENKEQEQILRNTELSQKEGELKEKIKELEDEKQLSEQELRKLKGLREELKRVREKLEEERREYFKAKLKNVLEKLGVSEDLSKKVEEYFNDKEVKEENLEEEVKKTIPQLDYETYWNLLKENSEMTNRVVSNASLGGVSGEPIKQEYSQEVLDYAQKHNLSLERAKKILERFSKPKRVLE
jgi:phenylalanyl-tRNA synthetase alpha subunit